MENKCEESHKLERIIFTHPARHSVYLVKIGVTVGDDLWALVSSDRLCNAYLHCGPKEKMLRVLTPENGWTKTVVLFESKIMSYDRPEIQEYKEYLVKTLVEDCPDLAAARLGFTPEQEELLVKNKNKIIQFLEELEGRRV